MKGRRNELTRELIRSKVDVDPATGCWVCRDVTTHGYGQIKINLKSWRAHRAAWVAFRGPIPKGIYVLHKCDNPPCCNPRHLFLGTNTDNVRDMIRKGRCRPPRGSKHGNARLVETDIPRILKLVKRLPRKEVALRYEVTTQAVTDIVLGRRWSHVSGIGVSSGK